MLVVVRPLMRAMVKRAQPPEDAPAQLTDGELTDEDMRMIQLGEGESIEDIKAKLRPRRSGISADMLDTANTYDDKVALIRMLVVEDSARVANVLKSMIKTS
jgi:flagellar M-ring protein FliF